MLLKPHLEVVSNEIASQPGRSNGMSKFLLPHLQRDKRRRFQIQSDGSAGIQEERQRFMIPPKNFEEFGGRDGAPPSSPRVTSYAAT